MGRVSRKIMACTASWRSTCACAGSATVDTRRARPDRMPHTLTTNTNIIYNNLRPIGRSFYLDRCELKQVFSVPQSLMCLRSGTGFYTGEYNYYETESSL